MINTKVLFGLIESNLATVQIEDNDTNKSIYLQVFEQIKEEIVPTTMIKFKGYEFDFEFNKEALALKLSYYEITCNQQGQWYPLTTPTFEFLGNNEKNRFHTLYTKAMDMKVAAAEKQFEEVFKRIESKELSTEDPYEDVIQNLTEYFKNNKTQSGGAHINEAETMQDLSNFQTIPSDEEEQD